MKIIIDIFMQQTFSEIWSNQSLVKEKREQNFFSGCVFTFLKYIVFVYKPFKYKPTLRL